MTNILKYHNNKFTDWIQQNLVRFVNEKTSLKRMNSDKLFTKITRLISGSCEVFIDKLKGSNNLI